jgi:error-prone DNA polymerase
MAYVELHCHSAFSFLDGACLPLELAAAARQRGHGALALTDHDSVSGSMEFALSARDAGVRAIHGAEVTVTDPSLAAEEVPRHLTLLVRDARGWSSLCNLLTRAHAHTRVYSSEPPSTPIDAPRRMRGSATRTSRVVGKPSITLEDVEAHAEGLVCLSGCARQGVRDEPTMRRLMRAFGRDAFRVELQRPFHRHDRALNRGLAALADRLGVPCVATGNVHAHTPARARLQDAFVAIREHTTLDASEPLRRGNHSHILTTPQAMSARFADHPDAVAETERLAETLTFDLTQDLGYRYPGAEEEGSDRQLAEVCHACFEDRYPVGSKLWAEAAVRLEDELRLIATLRLSGFFLLHREMLELARDVAIEVRGPDTVRALLPPGRGRGSSVSSIVCYLTGLSHIDPIANKLLLGRFLNEEISTLPDIDLDFPRDVREVLIPRVHDRFGRDRAALVAAFPTYRARGAIRELGKALGLPPGEIERVARGSEGWSAGQVDRDISVALGGERLVQDGAPNRWRWLAALAHEAHGLPRHLSQHSGGMIVATRPLVDCCPVVPAAMEGRQMVMWDKDSCSDAGFLKIDLLGLGMLSAVERCVELIAARRGERIDLSRIPYDDAPTFAAIQEAETTGVFQIESRAQMGSLRRTRPENLDDLTVQVAIVRPGPIQGGAVNPYIERRQRMRVDPTYEVPYDHPSLEPVLEETLGTIIFQDQVIEVAMAFAGFPPGEAEGLRRAMSRKRSVEAIEAHHRDFVEGAMAKWPDVDEALAERVWSMVVGFSGFGFPKAHGAAFGLLAYQSTWLRVHYGPEFLCALLDEQPMGFYPPDALIHEAQRRGIEILPPDVNASEVVCTVVDAPGSVVPFPRRSREAVTSRALTAFGAVQAPVAPPTPAAPAPVAPPAPAVHAPVAPPTPAAPAPVAPPAPAAPASVAPSAPASPTSPHRPSSSHPTPLHPRGQAPAFAAPARAAVRLGLGYVLRVRAEEVGALVKARSLDGPFRSLDDLAARAGAGAPSLSQLAWSGACDALAAEVSGAPSDRSTFRQGRSQPQGSLRRTALWRLGVAAPAYGVGEGRQLPLPLELPAAPKLDSMREWDAMIADYATTGLTIDRHPLRLLRKGLTARGVVSSAGLDELSHEANVHVAGLVVARQRPGTANGVCFLLLEDETGTVNVIVPPKVYERDRLTVRTEPLVVIEGVLERFASAGGAINILVRRLAPLDAPELLEGRPRAKVKDFSPLDDRELARIQSEQPRVAVAATGGPTAAHVRPAVPAGQAHPAADGGPQTAPAAQTYSAAGGGHPTTPAAQASPPTAAQGRPATVSGRPAVSAAAAHPAAASGRPTAHVTQAHLAAASGRPGAPAAPAHPGAASGRPAAPVTQAHPATASGGPAAHAGPRTPASGPGPTIPSEIPGVIPLPATDPSAHETPSPITEAPDRQPPEEASLPASGQGAEDFRAVAPPIMSFAQGRRR